MFAYLIIRLLTFPLAFLPYRVIHGLGKPLGTLSYLLIPKYRKRALANLALSDLNLSTSLLKKTAKKSLQSLMITTLEYPRLAREKNISKIATCINPEEAEELMARGNGVIFFCGHQANWELLFLEGTSRMPGVAIGRPIKNKHLYNWIQKTRQKFGGTIIPRQNGIKEGLRALRNGKFLGILGDQGMPESPFSSPFLGRNAYTSTAPAMLSYKTKAPIIVATTVRENGHYYIHYSKAIHPDPNAPKDTEVPRLMNEILSLYEASIRKRPHEWLWIHNRWKQQTLSALKRPYREDSIALFISSPAHLEDLSLLRTLYPTETLTLFVPKDLAPHITLDADIRSYNHIDETLLDDYRFKLIYNFTKNPKIDHHYRKKATQTISHPQSMSDLQTLVAHA